MVDIEKIVGKNNYARLKKARIANAKKLSALSEEEVMALAGIGPKTAHKLFKALGRNSSPKKMKRKYNKMSIRRKYRDVKASLKRTIKDPESTVRKLDRLREGAIAARNFSATVYNFGRPEGERIQSYMEYVPRRLEITESMLTSDEEVKSRFFLEFHVKREKDRFLLKSSLFDIETLENWGGINEFVQGPTLNESSQADIVDIISNTYNAFRDKSRDGVFVIILDRDLASLAQRLEQMFANDIQKEIVSIIENPQEYYEWEIILKYYQNPIIRSMVNRMERFLKFYRYQEYIKEPGNIESFEQFNDDVISFWDMIDKDKKAIIGITNNVTFGIVQADSRFYNFTKKGYLEIPPGDTQYVQLPNNFDEFKALQREVPMDVNGKKISYDILAMVNSTFDRDYDIWGELSTDPMIITSNKFPEWGFIIR